MSGMKLGVAILAVAVLAGVSRVEKSVCGFLSSDPQVLYLMAQYKIAVGDPATALQLVQKAKIADANCPGRRLPDSLTNSPHSRRG